MRLDLSTMPAVGVLLLGGLTGLFEASARAETAAPANIAAASHVPMTSEVAELQGAPRYVYASGFNGVQYYGNPGVQAAIANAAPAPRTTRNSGARPRTVGPGVRDWTTGQRLGSHKPWIRARS